MVEFAVEGALRGIPVLNGLNQERNACELPKAGHILCCTCGVAIPPNPAAMCGACLAEHVDMAEGIERQSELTQCRKCGRYQSATNTWVSHEWESNGLLTMCMKRVSGLYRPEVKVVGAHWIWTEPHSDRLRFTVDIQRQVLEGRITLQARLNFLWKIAHKQCLNCIREATDHTWGAMIQVRQYSSKQQLHKNAHKKLLHHLESLLTGAELFHLMSHIQVVRGVGFNFYFPTRAHADRVTDFISSHFPVRTKQSTALVSRDLKSNTARQEITTLIEIVPLNRQDLVLTSRATLGGRRELMLVNKMQSSIHLVDPRTLVTAEVNVAQYYSSPPAVILTERHLTPYVVLDITPLRQPGNSSAMPTASYGSKRGGSVMSTATPFFEKESLGMLAEAVVAREENIGDEELTYTVTTHLGHILQAGDVVMCYDLMHSVFSAEAEEQLAQHKGELPDLILVKKVIPEEEKRTRRRKKRKPAPWHTRRIAEAAAEAANATTNTAQAQSTPVSGQDIEAPTEEGEFVEGDEDDGEWETASESDDDAEDDYDHIAEDDVAMDAWGDMEEAMADLDGMEEIHDDGPAFFDSDSDDGGRQKGRRRGKVSKPKGAGTAAEFEAAKKSNKRQ